MNTPDDIAIIREGLCHYSLPELIALQNELAEMADNLVLEDELRVKRASSYKSITVVRCTVAVMRGLVADRIVLLKRTAPVTEGNLVMFPTAWPSNFEPASAIPVSYPRFYIFARYKNFFRVAALVLFAMSPLLLPGYHWYQDRRMAVKAEPAAPPTQPKTTPRQIMVVADIFGGDRAIIVLPTRGQLIESDINAGLLGDTFAYTRAARQAFDHWGLTGDGYYVQAVKDYRALPVAARSDILKARRLRAQFESSINPVDASRFLGSSENYLEIFERYGMTTEALRARIGYAMALRGAIRFIEATEIIDRAIKDEEALDRLTIKTRLLFARAQLLSEHGKFAESIKAARQAIALAERVGIPQIKVQSNSLIAATEFVRDNNIQALDGSMDALNIALENGIEISEQIPQIIGLAAFAVGRQSHDAVFEMAGEKLLQQSIAIVTPKKNYPYIAQGYAFLGLIRSMQSRHFESEECFQEAKKALSQVPDRAVFSRMEFAYHGYHARALHFAERTDEAIAEYKTAIAVAEQSGIKQALGISQLYQGLGEVQMVARLAGEAEISLKKAVFYKEISESRNEQNNQLLTFAITNRDCRAVLASVQAINQ